MARFNNKNVIMPDNIQIIFGSSSDFTLDYDSGGPYLLLDAAASDTFRIGNSNTVTLNLNGTVGVVGVLDEDDMSTNSATNLATQQSIKAYVDNAIEGLDPKAAVQLVTEAALPAYTRTTNQLDADANGALPNIDGVAASVGDRILLKDGAAGADNGIYVIDDLGSAGTPWQMTRAIDADEDDDVTQGLYTYASEGTVNKSVGYILTTADPITLNTTSLTFEPFFSGGNAHGLLSGLADDDHTQYALLLGRSGGQTLIGGTGSGDDLAFQTTSNGTKGSYFFSELTTQGAAYIGASGALLSEAYLGVSRGGTGVTGASAANGSLLIGNGTGYTLATLTGTTNEVDVTNASGSITLSLPNEVYLGTSGFLGRDADNGIDFATDAEVGIEIDGDADSFVFSDAALTINSDNAVATRALRLSDLDNSAYVGLKAANTTTTTYTLTMPPTDSTGNQALMSNGSGTLSWASVAAGETLPSSTVQYSLLVANASLGWVEDTLAKVTSGSLDLSGTITAGSGSTQITSSVGDLQQTYNFTNGTGTLLTDDEAVYTCLNKLDQGFVDLAATTVSNGASMIGIYDVGSLITATDVEGALQELAADTVGAQIQHGRETVALNDSEQAVTFGTAFGDTNYTLVTALTTTDGTPSGFTIVQNDKASAGFTAEFNGEIDTSAYVLEWIAIND